MNNKYLQNGFNSISIIILSLFFLKINLANAGISNRATGNRNATLERIVDCGNGYINGIEVKEQDGYGIVDVRIICSRNYDFDPDWAVGNPHYSRIIKEFAPARNAIFALEVYEQNGYGVIDIKPYYEPINRRERIGDLPRLTGNNNVSKTNLIQCPRGELANGIKVYNQRGYGVIDLQLLCQ